MAIPSSFPIPGTFVTIQGTGSPTTLASNVILMTSATALTSGSGASFDVTSVSKTTYTAKAITLNNGGTGYKVGDNISLINAGTLAVTAIDTNGVITTFTTTISTESVSVNMAGTGIAGVGGSGTGATFDITSNVNTQYQAQTITVNNSGTGYHVGDTFVIAGQTATTSAVNSNGGVSSVTFTADTLSTDPAGTNVNPSSTTTISGAVNTLVYAESQSAVDTVFGPESDISRMFARYRAVDVTLPVYVITSASSSGADITTALNAIPEAVFSVIASPFATSDATRAFENYFATRYGYAVELYGIHVTAKTDTVSNLLTLGSTVNSAYTTIVPFAVGGTDDDVVKAAAAAAQIAPALAIDPSQPLQGMLLDVDPSGNAFTIPDRESLFNGGLAITREDSAGNVYLERARTTYQTAADGEADNTYQDTETLPTVALVAETFRTGVNSKYFTTRMKLAPSTSTIISGMNIATDSAIKATLISIYQALEGQGLVVDSDTFAKSVQVTILTGGRVQVYAPVTLIDQLRQIIININFSKN